MQNIAFLLQPISLLCAELSFTMLLIRYPEKTADVSRDRHPSPRKTTPAATSAEIPHEMTRVHPGPGSASDWLKENSNQSEAPPRSGQTHVISMEPLRSPLRRRFARAQVESP